MKHILLAIAGVASVSGMGASAQAAVLAAQYSFGTTLASSVAGAPSLTAVDPAGTNSFGTDTVFGNTQNVYNFTGSATPVTQQGGLTFDNSGGLINQTSYSVEIVFKLNERQNAWRRIFDTQNRTSDTGFYVDPANQFDVFPTSGSTLGFTTGIYYDVVLTNSNGDVTVYDTGSSAFSTINPGLNITADNVLGFFVDNTQAGGQGEWSSGSVALIALYNGVLTADEVAALHTAVVTPPSPTTSVPEPASLALLLSGVAACGWVRRRT